MKHWKLICLLCAVLTPLSAQAQTWQQFLRDIRSEALQEGIRPAVLDQAFANIKAPSRRVLRYDRTQPERRLTFVEYRNTRADNYRIKIGRREYKKHAHLIKQVASEYGVDPCFIVSLWGLESSYGRFMGKFPVIKSLATLAFDKRRSAFFRKELMHALHMVNEGHVPLEDLKGEWAGATGQSQFLPSSWRYFAVDYDKDGLKDIWHTYGDIFASIANYLKEHGWRSNEPWAMQVTLPSSLQSDKTKHPLSYWRAHGIHAYQGQWPQQDLMARLVRPEGGPNYLAFNNFDVIMKWNRSSYYAGTVGYMADRVCRRQST